MADDVRIPSAQVPRKGRSAVVQVSSEGADPLTTEDVVVFNTGEGYFAIANKCPHKGWPLAGGQLKGCEVRCPWHGWCIDLKSGEVTDMEDLCYSRVCCTFRRPKAVTTFSVRKEGDSLVVSRQAA